MEKTKQDLIHDKGFSFGKLKTIARNVDDVVLDLSSKAKRQRSARQYNSKAQIESLIMEGTAEDLEALSEYFYRTDGIYSRTCNYFAQMYRYDWYVTPELYAEKVKEKKLIADFKRVLNALDNSYIKKLCGDIALQVIRRGVYYGYLVESSNGSIIMQELPRKYCRCRMQQGCIPVIDFNMRFFDDYFSDAAYRVKVLKTFPKDFQKGYVMFKEGKLKGEYSGDAAGWYTLEPGTAWRFCFDANETPLFINAIPSLVELHEAQDLDRRKQMQKLLKIIVQKLPTDKNGDLIFDIDEALDLHQNAVEMLANAIGVDVLTTFADIKEVSVSDERSTAASDDLERNERAVYNSFGVAQGLFNAEGNISLSNSILNDEGYVHTLLLQFQIMLDYYAQNRLSKEKRQYAFRLYMLDTTQYNYKEMSKMYKEQVQLGYSKMLPQIALGQSQSFILNSCHFENGLLKLHEIMIPPLMSSTMNSETILGKTGQSNSSNSQDSLEETKTGRPEKPESEKSDKTLANESALG